MILFVVFAEYIHNSLFLLRQRFKGLETYIYRKDCLLISILIFNFSWIPPIRCKDDFSLYNFKGDSSNSFNATFFIGGFLEIPESNMKTRGRCNCNFTGLYPNRMRLYLRIQSLYIKYQMIMKKINNNFRIHLILKSHILWVTICKPLYIFYVWLFVCPSHRLSVWSDLY